MSGPIGQSRERYPRSTSVLQYVIPPYNREEYSLSLRKKRKASESVDCSVPCTVGFQVLGLMASANLPVADLWTIHSMDPFILCLVCCLAVVGLVDAGPSKPEICEQNDTSTSWRWWKYREAVAHKPR